MARRKRGKPISGWIALDKPLGLGSTQAVSRVRRLFDAAKAGHGGTLDPLASGVLPIALGEATKTVPYVMDGSKTYRFTVRFGQATATDDAEGAVTQTSDARPTEAEIQAALPAFTGTIEQVPPAFSAIKIDGERAYDLARGGGDVTLAPRRVRIDRLTLIARPDADHATFEAVCGKGTYIRSLARDLALRLGTVGHVSMLRRTACGPFAEAAAFSLEKLEELVHSAAANDALLPIETALDGIPALALSEDEAARLAHGQAISLLGSARRDGLGSIGPGDIVLATRDGKPLGLAEAKDGVLRPVRLFNRSDAE